MFQTNNEDQEVPYIYQEDSFVGSSTYDDGAITKSHYYAEKRQTSTCDERTLQIDPQELLQDLSQMQEHWMRAAQCRDDQFVPQVEKLNKGDSPATAYTASSIQGSLEEKNVTNADGTNAVQIKIEEESLDYSDIRNQSRSLKNETLEPWSQSGPVLYAHQSMHSRRESNCFALSSPAYSQLKANDCNLDTLSPDQEYHSLHNNMPTFSAASQSHQRFSEHRPGLPGRRWWSQLESAYSASRHNGSCVNSKSPPGLPVGCTKQPYPASRLHEDNHQKYSQQMLVKEESYIGARQNRKDDSIKTPSTMPQGSYNDSFLDHCHKFNNLYGACVHPYKCYTEPIHKPYHRRGTLQLWQFLVALLSENDCQQFLAWTGRGLEFKLIDPEEVARRWGIQKNRPAMNYDKLSRSLRYYYEKGIMQKVAGERYVYRFACSPEALFSLAFPDGMRPLLKPQCCQPQKIADQQIMTSEARDHFNVSPFLERLSSTTSYYRLEENWSLRTNESSPTNSNE